VQTVVTTTIIITAAILIKNVFSINRAYDDEENSANLMLYCPFSGHPSFGTGSKILDSISVQTPFHTFLSEAHFALIYYQIISNLID
jgi:hypothetical protein